MQPVYRSAPESPTPTTIVYWGPSTGLLVGFTSVFVIWFVLSCALIVAMARTVTFDCDRAAGACTLATSYPLTGVRVETHALSEIRGATLTSTPGTRRSRPSYGVALQTPAGAISLSNRAGSFSQRDLQRRQIDTFLKGQAPRLHLVYDDGSPGGGLFGLLFASVPLLGLWLIWQNTRLRVDPGARAVVIERRRWPLRSSTQEVRFADVAGVAIRDERGRKGRCVYQVVLVRTAGGDLPLLPQPANDPARSAREAERLRSALSEAMGVSPSRYHGR